MLAALAGTLLMGSVLGKGEDANDSNRSSDYREQPVNYRTRVADVEALDARGYDPGQDYLAALLWAEVAERTPAGRSTPVAALDVQPSLPSVPSNPSSEGLIAEFERGYRDFGGREEWLSIFVAMGSGQWMNPICPSGESSGLIYPWRYGDSYHYSALQFAPSSWTTASQHTGLGNAEDLYHVGVNTAWWSNNTVPSEQWSCWP